MDGETNAVSGVVLTSDTISSHTIGGRMKAKDYVIYVLNDEIKKGDPAFILLPSVLTSDLMSIGHNRRSMNLIEVRYYGYSLANRFAGENVIPYVSYTQANTTDPVMIDLLVNIKVK